MNRWISPLLFALMLTVFAVWFLQTAQTGDNTVAWSEFKQHVSDGEITKVTFEEQYVVGTVEDEEPAYRAVIVYDDPSLIALLDEQGVKYLAQPNWGGWWPASFLLMPLVFIGIMFLFMSRQDGATRGAAAFGRSTASLVPEEGTGVTFADVAGVEEAADELREVVAFLQTPEKFTALGGRPPKGVLLVGPPGTGKTLLARAVAGEAGVPFFNMSGSSFVEMFVGVGAARVRDLFRNAEEHAPCIIFVDELDAVGRSRGGTGPGSNDEREQTLNQLLVEMDGFDNRNGIIVMAATNRPEVLDSALLRAGRFDRQVLVDRPDFKGRTAILEVHARKLKMHRDVVLEDVAKMTPGFAGAELANALNEAALLAARNEHKAITTGDIEEAIERTMAGLERKTRRLMPEERRTVAFHEVGHAICAAASPHADPVKKITIIPRGMSALGYTLTLPEEERYLSTKAKLLDQVTVFFGGRAAEELVFGDVTTGASDDIKKATQIVRAMVTQFGMSKKLGTVLYGDTGANPYGIAPALSPETAETIEQEVRDILERCHERAVQILHQNRGVLEEMSMTLFEKEVLDGAEMQAFLDQVIPSEDLADPPTAELYEA